MFLDHEVQAGGRRQVVSLLPVEPVLSQQDLSDAEAVEGGGGDGAPTPPDARGSDDASEDAGAVMIISMFHVNLGSVPTSIYWFVSKKFAGVRLQGRHLR